MYFDRSFCQPRDGSLPNARTTGPTYGARSSTSPMAPATFAPAGMSLARAATAGVDPRFVAMLRDLLVERAGVERGAEPVRATVGGQVASWDVCAAGCCANPRGPRPALCGRD